MSHPLNEIVAQPLQQIAAALAEVLSSADIAAVLGDEATRALGQRTRLGSIRLALTADVLRVLTTLPGTGTGPRLQFVAPLLVAAGRLFGEAVPNFQRFAALTREKAGEFLAAWSADEGPLGGNHADTAWAGLRLARMAAQLGQFEPLTASRALLQNLMAGLPDRPASADRQPWLDSVIAEPTTTAPQWPDLEPRPPWIIGTGRLGKPTCCRFDPESGRLAIGTEEGGLFVLDIASGAVCFGVRLFEDPGVVDLAFSPGTDWLLVASDDQFVRLFDVEGRVRWWAKHVLDEVQQLLPLNPGHAPEMLIAASERGLVIPLSRNDPPGRRAGRRIQAVSLRRIMVRAVFSVDPEQRLFAVVEHPGASDGHEDIRLLDGEGRRVGTLIGHEDVVAAAAFSPWGRLLASVGYDGTVRLWDTTQARQRAVWNFGPEYRLTSVAFSPDGRLLYVGSGEQTGDLFHTDRPAPEKGVLVIDVATGQELRRLATTHDVEGLTLSADGRMLALLGHETGVLLWDLNDSSDDATAADRVRPFISGWRAESFDPVSRESRAAALIEAARSGDLAGVQAALATGGPIDATLTEGETALHAAARAGQIAVVAHLLENGADSQRQDHDGRTPRWLALEADRREVAALFARRGETWDDERQILKVMREEGVEQVRQLLRAGADPDGRENATVVPPSLDGPPPGGATPLTQAAFLGDEALLEVLLDAGADPDRRDDVPLSPWGAALYGGRTSAAAYLVLRGANPDPGRSLVEVIRLGNGPAVARILESGLDVNELIEQPDGPVSALQVAIAQGRGDIVLGLLSAGAIPDRDAGGPVLLRQALECDDRVEVVRRLVQAGLDVNGRDDEGRTILAHLVAWDPESDAFDVAAFLLQSGAEVNARDAGDRTPLHHLARQTDADIGLASLLLAFDADATARDARGRTPAQVARRKGNAMLAQLLEDRRERAAWPRRMTQPRTADDFAFRGRVRLAGGQWADSIADYEQAIRLDPSCSDLGASDWFVRRAEANDRLGRPQPRMALRHYHQAIRSPLLTARLAHYRVADWLDPLFSWSANNLAWDAATWPRVSMRQGNLALEFAVEADRRTEGRSWNFADTLAAAYAAAGQFDRAVAAAERALTRAPEKEQDLLHHNLERYRVGQEWEDPDNNARPADLEVEPWLSSVERLLRAGRYREALTEARDAAEGAATVDQQIDLGRALLAWEDISTALTHLERAAGQLEFDAENSLRRVRVLLDLARARLLLEHGLVAQTWLDQAAEIAATALEETHPLQGEILALGAVCAAVEESPRAEELATEALAFCADHLPGPHLATARCLTALALLAQQRSNHDEALNRLVDVVEIQEQILGPHHPDVLATVSLVIEAMLALNEPERAIPYALHSREMLAVVFGLDHPRTQRLEMTFDRAINRANRIAAEGAGA